MDTSGDRIRIGLGEDLHRLVPDRALLLGGVSIDSEVGLLGHSDGDVVLHAVTDALLGATGQGDIGDAFPDDDPSLAGVNSAAILREVVGSVRRAGYSLVNIDVVIHAERPRLGETKTAIRESLASLLDVEVARVNVKAKTGEGLDAVGRGEAIACRVIALVCSDES